MLVRMRTSEQCRRLFMAGTVQDVCPLMLPCSRKKLSYEGFLSAGDHDYRMSVILPESQELKDARIDCDWKLKNLLRGYEGVVKKRLEQSRGFPSFLLELKNLVEQVMQVQSPFQSPPPPTMYTKLIGDLDALGWERVTHVDSAFRDLKINVDAHGRQHVLSIHLSEQHPSTAPVCNADLPIPFEPRWSTQGSLLDLVRQFEQELEKYQVFWDNMDEIDTETWVLEPENPNRASTQRRIVLGTSISLVLSVDALRPTLLPECRFLGPDHSVNPLRVKLHSRLALWDDQSSILRNLERLLEIRFPSPSTTQREVRQHQVLTIVDGERAGMLQLEFSIECGICYLYRLEGTAPEIACNNPPCSRSFHHCCLFEWLKSLSTSRQSFSTIFGECPYCSHPITVKVM